MTHPYFSPPTRQPNDVAECVYREGAPGPFLTRGCSATSPIAAPGCTPTRAVEQRHGADGVSAHTPSAPITLRPLSRQEYWRFAERIMNGSGASMRKAHMAAPLLHILTERDEMWCSGGRAMPFVSIAPRYCRTCLALAKDMYDDLAGE